MPYLHLPPPDNTDLFRNLIWNTYTLVISLIAVAATGNNLFLLFSFTALVFIAVTLRKIYRSRED